MDIKALLTNIQLLSLFTLTSNISKNGFNMVYSIVKPHIFYEEHLKVNVLIVRIIKIERHKYSGKIRT